MGTFGLSKRLSVQSKSVMNGIDIIRLPVAASDPLQRDNGTFKFMLGYDPLSAFSLEE